MQYFIRQLSSGNYEITKFDGDEFPSANYLIAGTKCTCPGGQKRGTCKHIGMVARWKPFHYFEGDILLPLPDELTQHEQSGELL